MDELQHKKIEAQKPVKILKKLHFYVFKIVKKLHYFAFKILKKLH